MAEIKMLTYLFWFIGLPIVTIGVLVNIETWKATVLFVLSAVILIIRIVSYGLDKYQNWQKKKMDLEEQRHKLDKIKKS